MHLRRDRKVIALRKKFVGFVSLGIFCGYEYKMSKEEFLKFSNTEIEK